MIVNMDINKLIEKHAHKPIRKQDVKGAKNLIGEIFSVLDSKLDTARRNFHSIKLDTQRDKGLTDAEKKIKIDSAEFNLLAIHQIVGSVADRMDECLDQWEKLAAYHNIVTE